MSNRKRLYWICQGGGWLLYVLLIWFFLYLSSTWNNDMAAGLLVVLAAGIAITHFFRAIVLRFDWLRMPPAKAALLVIPANLLMGALMVLLQAFSERLFDLHFPRSLSADVDAVRMAINALNFGFAFLLWSLVYFLVHFIENYKKAEIENLRRQAIYKEIELNKLKSQLNPHFMFNSMNSIRALVDEDPQKAKDSVTRLSNILRNTLLMGRNKLIPLEDECRIIRDYLELESTRLEERLRVEWKIDPGCERFEVPPLMLQTLVENGIKHGISKLPGGGKISIMAEQGEGGIHVRIRNSGHFDAANKPETGFGLINTRQRLELLYGDKATFSITNDIHEGQPTVLTSLFIPFYHEP